MKKPLFILSLAVAIELFWQNPAYAYLDPSIGSMVLQGIVALAAAIAVTGRLYWRKFLSLFNKKKEPVGDRVSEDK